VTRRAHAAAVDFSSQPVTVESMTEEFTRTMGGRRATELTAGNGTLSRGDCDRRDHQCHMSSLSTMSNDHTDTRYCWAGGSPAIRKYERLKFGTIPGTHSIFCPTTLLF
jgi:hypothetical protein